MLNTIKKENSLVTFFTDYLLENGYGVIINKNMPKDSFLTINIDEYYHYQGLPQIPAIADLLLVANELANNNCYHIYIIEMKNIKSPKGFTVKNIYAKFETAIEDFMKKRYGYIFLNKSYKITKCKLFFISDAYKLKEKNYTEEEINSFIKLTKIEFLQNMCPFKFRDFTLLIDYKLPNPELSW